LYLANSGSTKMFQKLIQSAAEIAVCAQEAEQPVSFLDSQPGHIANPQRCLPVGQAVFGFPQAQCQQPGLIAAIANQ